MRSSWSSSRTTSCADAGGGHRGCDSMARMDPFVACPRIELHVHLEATIRPERLLELGRRNGVKLPARTVHGLERFCRFSGFDRFIEVWVKTTSVLRHRQRLPADRGRLRRRAGGAGVRLRRAAVLALRTRAARSAVAGGVRGLLRRRRRGARAARRRAALHSGHHAQLPARDRRAARRVGGALPRPRRRRHQPGRERAPLPARPVREGVRHRPGGRAQGRAARRRDGRARIDPLGAGRPARRPSAARRARRRGPRAAGGAGRARHRL